MKEAVEEGTDEEVEIEVIEEVVHEVVHEEVEEVKVDDEEVAGGVGLCSAAERAVEWELGTGMKIEPMGASGAGKIDATV